MSVRQAEPPTSQRSRTSSWPESDELVAKALANRGEWFAIDVPGHVKETSVTTFVRSAFFRAVGREITIQLKDGVAYLRIGESL